MVVVPGRGCPPDEDPSARHLDPRFSLVISPDAELARRLALPAAAERCSPGYVTVDRDGVVRYRTYEPGWADPTQEQQILLDALDDHR